MLGWGHGAGCQDTRLTPGRAARRKPRACGDRWAFHSMDPNVVVRFPEAQSPCASGPLGLSGHVVAGIVTIPGRFGILELAQARCRSAAAAESTFLPRYRAARTTRAAMLIASPA